ncbi:MAG TPA: ethanolamine utilization protein EutJ [Firmicutes bacterium]|uniref:ethanolamine utilization protein EutJ n=1 Tax=Gelria sp. Kuro-4 TaxID=2796927 RepID=UPI0019C45023|nr:ethanolamine utilization protein EutJ [Gelria sp. Kuro-4]BCV25855.1 ethanolamine utilization protein EutJ [Gelria sp. Kuro-4]HHV58383.1 ethanolamine utilization protein EutJ [Bacillota bacterium]
MAELAEANALIAALAERLAPHPALPPTGPVHVGVDVGTANVVSVALGAAGTPLAGEITPARVVREGMIVDYVGAVDIVRRQLDSLRARLGCELREGASAVPPGTEAGNAKVTRHVLEAADLEVKVIIDEPSAAARVLGIKDGAVVDVGGGTTGISVLKDGRVVYTADEPTGGTHLDLVIAGRFGITTEEAERRKRDPKEQAALFPVVRPVLEKMATIARRHLAGRAVPAVYLVGGTCAFPGFERVMEDELGLPVYLPRHPLLVTPLGIAMAACEG